MRQEEKYRRLAPQQIADVLDCYVVMCSSCGHIERTGMFENILDAVAWIFPSWVRGHVDGWN